MASKMFAGDALFAAAAECFVTINGTRYNFAHAISLEAKAEKDKMTVDILGSMSKGNKAAGITYTGSMTLHYNQSIMRKMIYEYANTGVDTYFDIQIVNEDKTSRVGRQEVILKNCNIDGGIIAAFDASSSDDLQEDVDFTFESFEMPEMFKDLDVLTSA